MIQCVLRLYKSPESTPSTDDGAYDDNGLPLLSTFKIKELLGDSSDKIDLKHLKCIKDYIIM